MPEELSPAPRSSFLWRKLGRSVAAWVLAGLLGGGTIGLAAYDTGELSTLQREFSASKIEQRVERDEKRMDSLDQKLGVLIDNVEKDHAPTPPCTCVSPSNERFQISLGGACTQETIKHLRAVFRGFNCFETKE
jgi:hypothetical protein